MRRKVKTLDIAEIAGPIPWRGFRDSPRKIRAIQPSRGESRQKGGKTIKAVGYARTTSSEPPKSPVEKMVKNIMDTIDVIANERIKQELPRLDEILNVYDVAKAFLARKATVGELRKAVKEVEKAKSK
ncbi:MAG: hypothetical protein ACOX6M_06830 [Armatimonadota bacterium]|jgi:hypothetical protein